MRKLVLLLVCVLGAMPLVGQTTLNGAGATFPTRCTRSGSASTTKFILTFKLTINRLEAEAGFARLQRARSISGRATCP